MRKREERRYTTTATSSFNLINDEIDIVVVVFVV